MPKLRKRQFIIILLTIFFLLGCVVAYINFGRLIQEKFFSEDPIKLAEEQPVTCANDDTTCIQKNAQNLTRQLSGITVEFAKNQCNGPRLCPTPKPEEITTATKAIREYTRNQTIQLIPINGTTPSGIIYYCSKDLKQNTCWKLEAKSNKVISNVEIPKTPTPIQPSTKLYGEQG